MSGSEANSLNLAGDLEGISALDRIVVLGQMAPDALVVTDGEGRILYVNATAEQIFGYEPTELLGRPVEVLLPERLRSMHRSHRSHYVRAPTNRPMGTGLVLFGRRRDGHEFPVEVSLNALQASAGTMVVAFVRDISERIRTETSLADSEDRCRFLADSVEDYAIAMLDPAGRVTTWNRGAEHIEGYAAGEILGRHLSVLYLPQDVAAGVPDRELDRAASTGQVSSDGWRVRRDGTRFWSITSLVALRSNNNELRGFGRVTRDMTASKLAQARSEAVSDVTRAILQDVPAEEILQRIAEHSRKMLGADAAWVVLVDSSEEWLEVRAADGDGAEALIGKVLPREGSAASEAILAGEVLHIDSLQSDPRTSAFSSSARLGPAVFVPFSSEGAAKGALAVAFGEEGPDFSDSEVDLLDAFGSQSSVALGFGQARDELEQLRLLEDRERIARDLHDTVIQSLFAVGMNLEAAVRLIDSHQARDRVRQAVDQLDDVIRSIRFTIFTLEGRPERGRGVRQEILAIVEEASARLGFAPAVRLDGPVDSGISEQVADHLIPTLREALSNVVRHASASDVTVSLTVADRVVLRVEDNGVGLPAEGSAGSRHAGKGLHNLAERAAVLGGSMSASTRPAGGTLLEWRAPLPVPGRGSVAPRA